MDKTATTAYPIHDLLARRWSPLSFAARAVERETLGSVLEAARWAASCYNEQPWSFFVASRDDADGYEKLASCLVPGNRAWAAKAPVLMLSVARTTFARNGKPNRHAYHDVGLATGQLMLQAVALGLHTHAMGGFDAERAASVLAIPDGSEAVAMIALGYRGSGDELPEELRAREAAPRSRKELESFVFAGTWGEPAL